MCWKQRQDYARLQWSSCSWCPSNIPSPYYRLMITIIVWNCRGVGNPNFLRCTKNICHSHRPYILLLLEARASNASVGNLPSKLGYPNHHHVPSTGYSGGIWLLWKDSDFSMTILHTNSQYIFAGITHKEAFFIATFAYVKPYSANKILFWEDLLLGRKYIYIH